MAASATLKASRAQGGVATLRAELRVVPCVSVRGAAALAGPVLAVKRVGGQAGGSVTRSGIARRASSCCARHKASKSNDNNE